MSFGREPTYILKSLSELERNSLGAIDNKDYVVSYF